LPVLLALNALRRDDRPLLAAWPGVDVVGPDGKSEYDLIASNGEGVWVAECKTSAGGLPSEQLDGLLSFCRRHGALPVLAALDGTFEPAQRAAVADLGGLVLERDALIAGP
jgi:hypothetical protein